jgi:hypothetical protein
VQVVPPVQTFPQTPQLLLSEDVLTHDPRHHFSPGGHDGLQVHVTGVQTPFRQTEFVGQECPQSPQLSLSELRS